MIVQSISLSSMRRFTRRKTVILKNMPVLRKSGNEYKPVNKKVMFIFYNATTQTETKAESSNGVLPGR